VVAITDVGGGVFADVGLDVPALARRLREHGTIAGAPETQPIDNETLFGLEVDVLVLAALEGQITAANAATVKARILAEGANGPTDPAADPILHANGVTVIPDILCNAGGVIVSYFEWAQNRAALAWTRDEVNDRLRRQILAAADEVAQRSETDAIPPRLAAHAIAVERVAEATRLRGLYP
jgi:glutamate dehydrogenase (NAD(P)+)